MEKILVSYINNYGDKEKVGEYESLEHFKIDLASWNKEKEENDELTEELSDFIIEIIE